MSVQELIEQLQKIEDKTLSVAIPMPRSASMFCPYRYQEIGYCEIDEQEVFDSTYPVVVIS